jgi:magnesium-transporting ATPase (P-type)
MDRYVDHRSDHSHRELNPRALKATRVIFMFALAIAGYFFVAAIYYGKLFFWQMTVSAFICVIVWLVYLVNRKH